MQLSGIQRNIPGVHPYYEAHKGTCVSHLCTLEDEEDRQVQSETKINKYSRQLKKCVGESIRYSDIYTSYGKVQFLIMLIGIKREDCEIVKKRINRQFAKKNPRVAEKYHVNSIVCEL